MNEANIEVRILFVSKRVEDLVSIKKHLEQDMRVRWTLNYSDTIDTAVMSLEKIDMIILDLDLQTKIKPEDIFDEIEHRVFEIPIIALTGGDEHNLGLYVMEKGAADTMIRGQFFRLVDAIEFALIRQKIVTRTRMSGDKNFQDIRDKDDVAHKKVLDQMSKEIKEDKNALSLFMGGYSVSNQEAKDKKKKK